MTEFRRVNSIKNGETWRTRGMENSKNATFKSAYSERQGHVVRHVIAPMYLVVKHSGA